MKPYSWVLIPTILAGCQSMPAVPALPPQPIVITKQVQVPVPVPCVGAVPLRPQPPSVPDIKKLTADFSGAWDGVAWLKGWIAILAADDAKLRAALLACVKQ